MQCLNLLSTTRRIIANDYFATLFVAIIWQMGMTLIGYAISHYINPSTSLLSHTFHWDAGWYQIILNDQYKTNAASAAFYPLFPSIVAFVSTLSLGFIHPLVAAQIVNLVSLWLGLSALLKIARHFIPADYRFLPILLLLSTPAAFFLHMFYSEAIFIALGFWAYVFALEKRWLFSCLLLALLTACRLPALLFVGLCFLEFCRAYDWQPRKIFNKKILLFFVSPLGFITYGVYLAFVRDNFFAMFAAYDATTDWAYQVFNFNIFETVGRISYQVLRSFVGLRPINHDVIVNHLIPLLCLGLLLTCSIYLIVKAKDKGLPLGIFGLLSFIMFTLNGNVVSAHRYILPCIAIYIAIGIMITNHKWLRTPLILALITSLVIQSFLLFAFISNNFAG